MVKTTVGALIYREVGTSAEVLITKRNFDPFKDYWCLPGGHIDPYEEAVHAVIREVKEETGLIFTPQFLHFFDEVFPDRELHNVVLMFFGKATGNLVPDPIEVDEAKWVGLEEALAMDLAFGHTRVLRYFQERNIVKV